MSRSAMKGLPLLAKDLYSTKQRVSNVYIHLPFCQKKCHFCAFPVHAVGVNLTEEVARTQQNYMASLINQIELSQPYLNLAPSLKSLYIGGGTPSLFDSHQIRKICNLFRVQQTQVTLQMNPSQLGKLQSLLKAPINRFSLGIQTFDKNILQRMNRLSKTDRVQIYQALTAYRPQNLSLDFILDFCLEDDYFKQMIDFIEQVSPEHVTLYMLEVNQGSFLQANLPKFTWLPKQNKVVQRYIQACTRLRSMGYHHYQISNFSKNKNYYSQHNQCYWAGNREFLAYGMGAASLTKGFRITRPTNVNQYHKFVNCLKLAIDVDIKQLKLDIVDENYLQKQLQSIFMSGLRWEGGVEWNQIKYLGYQRYNAIRQTIHKVLTEINHQRDNLIRWSQIEERIALTSPHGYLLADYIANRIITALEKIQQL